MSIGRLVHYPTPTTNGTMPIRRSYSPSMVNDPPPTYTLGTYVTPEHLCPDLLRLENLGPADNLRGRVVRGFFRVLTLWPVKRRNHG